MKQFLTLVLATCVIAVAPSASALPTAQKHTPRHFAAIRLRIAHRVDHRYEEWLAEKHERRQRIHDRRETRAAAEAAAEAATLTEGVALSPTSYSMNSSSWQLSTAEVASYARTAGFPESAIPTLVAIVDRESNACPTAVYGYGCAGEGHAYNGGPACGLAQLWPCPGSAYLDPLTNLRGAYAKYQASGWAPWGG